MKIEGRSLVVVRKDAAFYALRDTCPHQGGPLSLGRVSGTPDPCLPGDEVTLGREGEILTCPWHGWEFDMNTGRALADPLRRRVKTYPVRIRGNRVWVAFE